MTDIHDFSSSFRRIVETSDSTDEVRMRLKRPLSLGQRQILDDYFEQKERQKEKPLRPAISKRQVAQFRYQKLHPKYSINYDRELKRLFIRNTRGRFVRQPSYLKRAFQKRRK